MNWLLNILESAFFGFAGFPTTRELVFDILFFVVFAGAYIFMIRRS